MKPTPTMGQSFPLGATVLADGVNFSVFSKHATGIELLLFASPESRNAERVIRFDPARNRTANYWHIFIPGLSAGQIYAYRIYGPFDPARGLRYDDRKVLLDPYGKSVIMPEYYDRGAASVPGDNEPRSMRSVVVDNSTYDWEGDTPLNLPSSRTIIYEMHVKGFTADPSSALAPGKRGTYAGLIEKIPYLKDLGITAVELLPVFHFDPFDCSEGKINYWGYAPISFFAPHSSYSSDKDPLGPVNEFRDMVKALHKAGIEVILDVVYNHTAEGNENGPTLCFRGFENESYYILNENRQYYQNYSGCGNTMNANDPFCRRLILDSLRYWVQEMHVDGFRFDLASILSRDSSGQPLANPPVLWEIDTDPVLAGTKLIAEAWDAAGLYQVGDFVGDKWKEWNGRFRDDIRNFWRGSPASASKVADRMVGSPHIYGHKGREAEQTVNFVTCHDGFTLYDLVSYNQKHNEANGENNNDGGNDNNSWNCGVEGPTDHPDINQLRKRQVKNFFTVTLLSLGVPMILMGDEICHTQHGNNNAYCQDNELSWFNWNKLEEHADIRRFLKTLIARRSLRDLSPELQRLNLFDLLKQSEISWHGVKLNQPDWSDNSQVLAMGSYRPDADISFHMMFNAYWQALEFEIPKHEKNWHRWVDTALESPYDITPWQEAPIYNGQYYTVQPRSAVLLMCWK